MHPTFRVLGQELVRWIVWYERHLPGWAFIRTESTLLHATPATVLGPPTITALVRILGSEKPPG